MDWVSDKSQCNDDLRSIPRNVDAPGIHQPFKIDQTKAKTCRETNSYWRELLRDNRPFYTKPFYTNHAIPRRRRQWLPSLKQLPEMQLRQKNSLGSVLLLNSLILYEGKLYRTLIPLYHHTILLNYTNILYDGSTA